MSKEALLAKERGNAAYKNRDFGAAHAYYDVAIRLSPEEMIFHFNKSAVFFEERKFDECIAACETALNLGSGDKKLIEKVKSRIAKARKAQDKGAKAREGISKAPAKSLNAEFGNLSLSSPNPNPLHNVYVSKLIPLLMAIKNDDVAGARLRNLVLSSPKMSAAFVEFVRPFEFTVRDLVYVHFFGQESSWVPNVEARYVKKWTPFSWMAPFIVELSISGAPPRGWPAKWVYNVLPRTSKVLTFFRLWIPDWIHEPLHPNVLPFIRRQLPNLKMLHGPIDFFLEIPPDQVKKFQNISIVVRRFATLPTLFKTKRFTSSVVEFKFIQPPNGGVDYASNLVSFLKTVTFRMPETTNFVIRMPVLNARFPAGDMVKALCTVFPNLHILTLWIKLDSFKKIAAYDCKRLTDDYNFLKKEVKSMPSRLHVRFHFEENVEFVNFNAVYSNLYRNVPRGFTFLGRENQNPWNPPSAGFINDNDKMPICHMNKFFSYEVIFE